MQQHPAIPKLLTNENILAKAVDILGFNISAYHVHINVTPPPPEGGAQLGQLPTAAEIRDRVKTFRFHQDSGQPADMEAQPDTAEPMGFSIKCGYFLTDTSQAGKANTW